MTVHLIGLNDGCGLQFSLDVSLAWLCFDLSIVMLLHSLNANVLRLLLWYYRLVFWVAGVCDSGLIRFYSFSLHCLFMVITFYCLVD